MTRILITILIFFGLHLHDVNAQSSLQWLMKNKDFEPILRTHMNEVKKNETGGWPTVSVLFIQPDTSGLVVYLTSFALLSELQDHLPGSYKFVESQPFIIYDGSERLISDTLSWFGELKSRLGYRLCDDLTYREELKKPGPKEVRIPCSFIYEPPIERFIFKKGKLVEKKVVAEMPF